MCTIHTVMSTDSTVLLLFTKTKQKNQCNEASRTSKRAQRYLNIKYGEVSLRFEFTTLPPKPQPLYEMKNEKETGKTRKAVRLIVHV